LIWKAASSINRHCLNNPYRSAAIWLPSRVFFPGFQVNFDRLSGSELSSN
jgi:hypothetical protein